MSEQLRESLSALMDGEASAFEVRRVLDEVRRDGELRHVWNRWQRVSAALQGGAVRSDSDLADRVWANLQDDPVTGAEAGQGAGAGQAPVGRQRNWGRVTAWVAASAAAIAVVVAANFSILGGGEDPSTPQIAARPEAPVPQRPLANGSSAQGPNVNVYMLQHMQHKAVNQPDVGAFTKLVTFEPESRP